ncbi:hypothetical protein BH11MYX1_BH11MYX1_50890 [soil metagenome]
MKNLALITAALLGACTTSSSISVDNESNFTITELYLTDINSSSWGPNLVSGNELLPGDVVRIDTSCGTYDAMLVDETGVTCELNAIDLCLDNALWVIHNDTCTAFREAAAQRDAARASASSAAQ